MATDLKAANLIDGIGFQLHVNSANADKGFNETALRNVFTRISDLDLEIHITEMTIAPDDAMYDTVDTVEEKIQLQGEVYAKAIKVCREFELCK